MKRRSQVILIVCVLVVVVLCAVVWRVVRVGTEERPDWGGRSSSTLLSRQVKDVRVKWLPLDQAFAALGAAAGVPIEPDWKKLALAGVRPDRPVELRLHDVPLDRAMQLLLEGLHATAALSCDDSGGKLIVVPEDDLPVLMRVYDLRPLTAGVPEREIAAAELSGVQPRRVVRRPTTARAMPVAPPAPSADPFPLKAVESIDGLLWSEVSKPSASISPTAPFADGILAVQPRPRHRRIARFLESIAAARAGEKSRSPTASPSSPLARPIHDLRLESTTLDQAIDSLRDATGTNIFVDWRSLDLVGVSKDKPVRLRVREGNLATALAAVLAYVRQDVKLDFCDADGVVCLSDHLSMSSRRSFRAYDVSRILDAAPQPTGDDVEGPIREQTRNLLRVISTCLNPGGHGVRAWVGSIHSHGNLLLAEQPPEGFRRIELALRAVRDAEASSEVASSPRLGPAGLRRDFLDPVTDALIPELDLENVTLAEALERVHHRGGPLLRCDWVRLRELGMKEASPLHLHLWDVTPARAVEVILATATADDPLAVLLDFNGTLTFTSDNPLGNSDSQQALERFRH